MRPGRRRRGGLRRRQGDPRVDGPGPAPRGPRAPPDLVITGAVVLDHWGVVKADVGIRDGRIVALGKAGNPDTMDGVHPELVIGPSTEIIAGNGPDPHRRRRRLPRPPHLPADRRRGARRRHHDADRRRHRPGRGDARPPRSPRAPGTSPGCSRRWTRWPVNVALLGKGNTVSAEALWEQVAPAPAGFKLHEDWGATPAAIDACLRVADEAGRPGRDPHRHPQRGRVRRVDRSPAIAGRAIHAYHTEGAGGGHAPGHHHASPGEPNVLPVLDQPDPPAHGQHRRRAPRHADGLPPPQPRRPGGPRLRRESRIRPSTIAAEDLLHDLGAISMIGSRLPGDGPHRRGRPAHLADRARR